MNDQLQWIAVDWGTTHLRVYGLNAKQEVIFQQQSAQGMASLTPDEYEPVLLAAVQDSLPENQKIPVLACGMFGAKQGWSEAPYAINLDTDQIDREKQSLKLALPYRFLGFLGF